jgi:hypothetical protein
MWKCAGRAPSLRVATGLLNIFMLVGESGASAAR